MMNGGGDDHQEAGPSRRADLRSSARYSTASRASLAGSSWQQSQPPAAALQNGSFRVVDSLKGEGGSGSGSGSGRSPRTPRVRPSPYASRASQGGESAAAATAKSPFGAPALGSARALQHQSSARKLDLERPAARSQSARAGKAKAEEDVQVAQEAAKSPGMLASFLSLLSPYRSARKERSAAFGSDVDPREDEERRSALLSPPPAATGSEVERARGPRASLGGSKLRGALSQSQLSQARSAAPASAPGGARYSRAVAPPRGMQQSTSTPLALPLAMMETDADDTFEVTQHHRRAAERDGEQPAREEPAPAARPRPSFDRIDEDADAAIPTYSPHRNYALLAKFFAEKSGAGSGDGDAEPLTELELAGCMKLLEECASAGRDLESEIGDIAAGHDMAAGIAASAGGADPRTAGSLLSPRRLLPPSVSQPAFSAAHARSPSPQAQARFHRSESLSSSLYDADIGGRPVPHLHASQSFLSPYRVQAAAPLQTAPGAGPSGFRAQPAITAPASAGASPAAARRTVARRRTIYLGPGLSASAAASARPSAARARASIGSTAPPPAGSMDNAASAFGRKRTRREEPDPAPENEDSHVADESTAPPPAASLQSSAPSSPFTFRSPRPSQQHAPEPTATPTRQRPAEVPPPAPVQAASPAPPTPKSATATALLNILQEQPLEASPRPQPRLEVVNPYQSSSSEGSSASTETATASPGGVTTRSRARDRGSISERMAKSRAQAVANAKRKAAEQADAARRERMGESVLELIEKTAPSPANSKRLRSAAASSGKDAAAAKDSAKPADEQPQPMQVDELAADKADKKKKATVEARKRMQELQEKEKDKERASEKAKSGEKAKAGEASASPSKAAAPPASKPSSNGSLPAPSGFSFNLPAQFAASIPKKPSPLATAMSAAPDSPGSDRDDRSGMSSAQTTPSRAAAAVPAAGSFTFSTPTAKPPPPASSAPATSTTPASAPIFQFSTPAAPALKTPAQTPAAPQAPPSTPKTPRDIALAEPPAALPSFDFSLPTRLSQAMLSAAERAARDAALSTLPKDLPAFKFDSAPAAAASKPAFSFGSPAASAPPAGSKSFAMPAASPTAIQFSPPKAAPPAPDAPSSGDADDGEITARDKGPGEGEEDEDTQHEVRAKAWRKNGAAWKDVGVGMLRLKRNRTTDKRRMLMRSEGNGNVLINFNLFPGLSVRQDKTQIVFMGFDGADMVSFRVKVKSAGEAESLKAGIEKEVAALGESSASAEKKDAPAPAAAAAPSAAAPAPAAQEGSGDAAADSEDAAADGEVLARDQRPGEGEEDEETQHEVRAKAWKKDGTAWKDVGVGMLRLKLNKTNSKRRMLMRSEGNGNVLINFNLFKGLTVRQDKTQVVFMGFEGSDMVNFRVKVKAAGDAAELKDAIEKEAAQVA